MAIKLPLRSLLLTLTLVFTGAALAPAALLGLSYLSAEAGGSRELARAVEQLIED